MPQREALCLKWPELRKTRPSLRPKQIGFGCNGLGRTKTEQNEAGGAGSSLRGGGRRHASTCTKELKVISAKPADGQVSVSHEPSHRFKIWNKSCSSLQFALAGWKLNVRCLDICEWTVLIYFLSEAAGERRATKQLKWVS